MNKKLYCITIGIPVHAAGVKDDGLANRGCGGHVRIGVDRIRHNLEMHAWAKLLQNLAIEPGTNPDHAAAAACLRLPAAQLLRFEPAVELLRRIMLVRQITLKNQMLNVVIVDDDRNVGIRREMDD